MAIIRPFYGVRPVEDKVSQVACKPYDVLNSSEARSEVVGNPDSFLHVIKSEVDLPENVDTHSQAVYQKARENFLDFLDRGVLIKESKPCYYLYQQIMDGRKQTGLISCSSIEDYENDVIKKHEYTRPVKENDRINHVKISGIHSGPVFITYKDVDSIDRLVERIKGEKGPVYDFVAEHDIQHTLWIVDNDADIAVFTELFNLEVPCTYIADGHHRAASAYKVGRALREDNEGHNGDEEYNYFLSVLFPANQLHIIDYNRVVKDLNGHSKEDFMDELRKVFDVEVNDGSYYPEALHHFGMYIDGQWYHLKAKSDNFNDNDPIGVLDVTILQDSLLTPILGIDDPRTNDRVDFVGGIRGLGELEKRVNSGEMAVAFSLYPVSLKQLMDISDSGNVMPPKSTWFEPKLKSGVVVHELD
jgi:uncharacterized protein (DUF1015 family)